MSVFVEILAVLVCAGVEWAAISIALIKQRLDAITLVSNLPLYSTSRLMLKTVCVLAFRITFVANY